MTTTTQQQVPIPEKPNPLEGSIQDEIDRIKLAAEYVRLGGIIEQANERRDEIANKLRALAYGSHAAGELTISIQHNRRPDSARIVAEYPQEQYPSIYKSTVDVAAFKRYVAPIIVESFQVEGPAKVIIK